MKKISQSPERGSFQAKGAQSRMDNETDPAKIQANIDLLDWYDRLKIEQSKRIHDPEWQKDNLEYDLRTTEWILAKVRANKNYAQNLYAAMCNRDFIKLEVLPILKNQVWGCSWRHAGGIIADMREEGDYIDWYCSGIQNFTDDFADPNFYPGRYVEEGYVTDEIRADLQKLGWTVVDERS